MTMASAPTIAIAANNGDIGGGEVMLLAIAEALREIGHRPLVLGPTEPSEIIDAAADRGFATHAIPASSRPAYMVGLALWRLRNRRSGGRALPLWCNGLVPSLATVGQGPRLLELHALPAGVNRFAAAVALADSAPLVVPSRFMKTRFPRARVLWNWVEDPGFAPARDGGAGEQPNVPDPGAPIRIGFLGRLTRDKGVDVLLHAFRTVQQQSPRPVELVLGGENRFGTSEDDRVIQGLIDHTEDVRVLGWVPRGELFAQVDLCVFPSRAEETFGLVVAEAMAAGMPFIISDAGALPEVAGPEHPFRARNGNDSDLARVILKAIDELGDDHASLLRRARRRYEEDFSPEAGTRRLRELLTDLTWARSG
ncbi:glycosyltransferase family 4 protein [Helcobacillus massiliensis]